MRRPRLRQRPGGRRRLRRASCRTTGRRTRRTARSRGAPAKKPQFANVFEWFDGFFRPVIRRKIGDSDSSLSWDARWWAYPEVVARLTALHYSWEEARASDSMSAMSLWWIQHLEPHLRVILDGDTGPMANAKESRDWMGWPVLPVDDVPADVFNYIVNNGERAEE
ncbi:DUF4913 domain-containing protein [Rhodococcus hoagii]|nr:DUF4913 domain-containing protein [Prescottella equi]